MAAKGLPAPGGKGGLLGGLVSLLAVSAVAYLIYRDPAGAGNAVGSAIEWFFGSAVPAAATFVTSLVDRVG